MDTLGISCNGAMPFRLVSITNAVAAIPEFADDSFGIVTPGEDTDAMSSEIALLYEQPLKVSAMSEAATRRVRGQSDAQQIVHVELSILLGDLVLIR